MDYVHGYGIGNITNTLVRQRKELNLRTTIETESENGVIVDEPRRQYRYD
tara:strand:+ start:1879 stop:2028 length:150 start_codon:yes stop_codon:yes gene_type:complete